MSTSARDLRPGDRVLLGAGAATVATADRIGKRVRLTFQDWNHWLIVPRSSPVALESAPAREAATIADSLRNGRGD